MNTTLANGRRLRGDNNAIRGVAASGRPGVSPVNALHLVEEEPGGPQLAANQAGVARHVDQRQHQRRDADIQQRLRDLLVGCRKRLPRMWVTHHAVLPRFLREQTQTRTDLRLTPTDWARLRLLGRRSA